jgi:hypothetical protein
MTRDASLDEFLGGGDGESGGEATEDEGAATEPASPAEEPPVDGAEESADATESDDPPADAEGEEDPPLAPAAVDPAHSTYDWSPDGADCADCGETAEVRWHDEPGLVCTDCKEW